jgi:small subunit ribosomal protein S7
MARKRKTKKKSIIPDFLYKSKLISILINMVMLKGKKSLAQRIVYEAIRKALKKLSLEKKVDFFLSKILENASPKVELKSRRIGGSTYQVPIEISSKKQKNLVLRWIVQFSRKKKKGISMKKSLTKEMIDAYNETGSVIKKKEEIHRMARANRAFTHLKW